MPAPLTVAVAQPPCHDLDVAANAAAHADAVTRTRARLVVFPELSLTGYNLTAPPLDPADPRLDPLVRACQATGSTALAGAPVRDADGRESIALLAVTGQGTRVAYRKMWLYGPEHDRFTPGPAPHVLDLDGWRLGLAVCFDASNPQHAHDTAALGTHAYVVSALYRAEEAARRDQLMRTTAARHRLWTILAAAAGPSGSYPHTSGGSGIWTPDGSPAAQAGPRPGETALTVLH